MTSQTPRVPAGPRATICPSTNHDGAHVPVTRHIDADHPINRSFTGATRIEAARCTWCAEGLVATLLRDGYQVTVWPVEQAFTEQDLT